MENKDVVSVISETDIKEKIYTIRGVQVMLDSDLAKLYQVETKNLNKAMKRNIERFPERYCFRLTQNEYDDLKFQFGTSNEMGGRRYLPYVFTEQGVAMLSGVLHSKIAVEISIRVIDTFVEMRRYLADNALLFQNIGKVNQKLMEHEEKIDVLFKQLEEPREKKAVLFFKGQLFDSFSCLADIISKAKEKKKHIVKKITDDYLTLTVRYENTIQELEISRKCFTEYEIQKKHELEALSRDVLKYKEQFEKLNSIERKCALTTSSIVLEFKEMLRPRDHKFITPTSKQWKTLLNAVKRTSFLVYDKLEHSNLTEQERRIAVLTYLGFSGDEIGMLVESSPQRVSNAKRNANKKAFGKDDSKTFKYNLTHLYQAAYYICLSI